MKFRIRIITLFLLVFFLSFSVVNANMQLIPPLQEVEVDRGYSGTFTVTIRNNGDEDVPSKFDVLDMDIDENGAPFIADSVNGYERGCGKWIVLDPKDAIIKSTESLVLTGTVTVPRDAEGGYYALIRSTFIGTTIPLSGEKAKMKDGSSISLGSQAVVAILLTVPSSRNKAVLRPDTLYVYPHGEEEKTELDFSTSAKKGWQVVLPVRNEGNVHTRVSGVVNFWSESGTRIASEPLQAGRGYVLPGKVRNLTAKGENVLADGYYMIRLSLLTSEGSQWTNSLPFAVYQGEVHPGSITDELAELIRASSPGFSMGEPFVKKQITPGGVTYVPIQLVSIINDTLILYPRKMEWTLNSVGQPLLDTSTKVQSRSCTNWIEFIDNEVILLPGRRSSFRLKINSPQDISGEYYSAVVFDPDRPRPDLPSEFLPARTQLLALSTPKNLEYKIEVGDISVKQESSAELSLCRFVFKVKNTGNSHCFVSGSMSLEKQAAPEVYKSVGVAKKFGNTQVILLPNGERTFEIDIPNLSPGVYRTVLATNYHEETQPVVKNKKFTIK